jgi:RNA polymerase sigma factor (sigma-70 family)
MRFASDALPVGVLGSRRLLALTGDDALVAQMRRGNEAAYAVAFDRYGAQILGFCRHMLGSTEEAEDVVQHTFAAAFRDLGRNADRSVALKPWLYTIARNRCVSILRARHEQPAVPHEPSTIALADEVERRAEVQELLEDMLELPEDQRAALLLSQGGALSHAEVAEVLGCEAAQVKGLVFRARTALIQRREARDTPCAAIREQLANLRGGALRRTELRHHLHGCAGCRAFREHVREQRRLLGVALPVAPSLALKGSVLGGAAGGGGLTTAVGGGAVAKLAVAGVLACGSAALVVESERQAAPPSREAAVAKAPSSRASAPTRMPEPSMTTARTTAPAPVAARPVAGGQPVKRRALGRRRAVRRRAVDDHPVAAGHGQARAAERRARPEKARGRARTPPVTAVPRGRGPIAAPPAKTPVRRGPPVQKLKPAKAGPATPQMAAPPKLEKSKKP